MAPARRCVEKRDAAAPPSGSRASRSPRSPPAPPHKIPNIPTNTKTKQTIIEALKFACTGELPPNSGRAGNSFVHDPRLAGTDEVKALIKLRVTTSAGRPFVVVRSLQVTRRKGGALTFKSLEAALQTIDRATNDKRAITMRCTDIDRAVPTMMGVSKAILESVIFVHQEDSCWPLGDGASLKRRFDDIFAATKYSKALETLARLRKDKAAEARELKARLETLAAHCGSAKQERDRLAQAERAVAEYARLARQRERTLQEVEDRLSEVDGALRRHAARHGLRADLAARREVLAAQEREALDRLPEGDPSSDPRADDELQNAVDLADQAVREQRDGASAARRGANDKRLEAERLKSEFGRQCQEHGRLAAAAEAHARAVSERDAMLIEASKKLGLPLPEAAERARETGQAIPHEAAAEFEAALDRHSAAASAELEALRRRHAEADGELARGVDEASRAVAEAEGEVRLRREQADSARRQAQELEQQAAAAAARGAQAAGPDAVAEEASLVRTAEARLEAARRENDANQAGVLLEAARQRLAQIAVALTALQGEREAAGKAAEATAQWRVRRAAAAAKKAELLRKLQPPECTPLCNLLGIPQIDETQALQLQQAAEDKARQLREAAAAAEQARRLAQQRASESHGAQHGLEGQVAALRDDRASADAKVWSELREARERVARDREERLGKLRTANAQALAQGAGSTIGSGDNAAPPLPPGELDDVIAELLPSAPGQASMAQFFPSGSYLQPAPEDEAAADGGGAVAGAAGAGTASVAGAAAGGAAGGGGPSSLAPGGSDGASVAAPFAYQRLPGLIADAETQARLAARVAERLHALAMFVKGQEADFRKDNCCKVCQRPFASACELEAAVAGLMGMVDDAPMRARVAVMNRRLAEEWLAAVRKASEPAAAAQAASHKLRAAEEQLCGAMLQGRAARDAELEAAERNAVAARESAESAALAVRTVAAPAADLARELERLEAEAREAHTRMTGFRREAVAGAAGGGMGMGSGYGAGSLTVPDGNYVPSSIGGAGGAAGASTQQHGAQHLQTQGGGGLQTQPGGAQQPSEPRDVTEIDRDIARFESDRRMQETAREEAARAVSRAKDALVSASGELQEARARLQNAQAAVARQRDAERRAAELHQRAEEHEATAKAREHGLQPARDLRDRLSRERDEARKAAQALEAQAEVRVGDASGEVWVVKRACAPVAAYARGDTPQRLERARQNMEETDERARAAATAAADLERRARELEAAIAQGGAARRASEDLLAWRRAKQRLDAVTAELAEAERAEPGVRPAPEMHARRAELVAEREDAQREIAQARGASSVERAAAADARAKLAAPQLSGADDRHRAAETDHRLLTVALADLDRYQRALERALLDFHSAKMAEVNRSVRELWQKVYRGSDIDHVAIKADAEGAAARSYNYRVVMVASGAELDMRGRCSAGQKVLASLVIRLALAECFCASCGVLALDEPTTNLDADNARSLAESLRSLMEARKGQDNFQVVVITHDEEFAHQLGTREFAETLWRVTKDDRGHTNVQAELIDA